MTKPIDPEELKRLLAMAPPGEFYGRQDEELMNALYKTAPALIEELEALRAQYLELIHAVASTYPGESRHETALRYITQRERGSCQSGIEAT